MIIKIQRPIMTTEPEPMALIYNQSRSFEVQLPFAWFESIFEPGELKIYAKAKVKNKMLVVGKKLRPMEW